MSTSLTVLPALTRYERIILELKKTINRLTGFDPAEINIHQSYLDAGVESLLLIQVGQAIHEQFGIKVSLTQLLDELATIGALAAYLDKMLPAEELPSGLSQVMPSIEPVPQKVVNEPSPDLAVVGTLSAPEREPVALTHTISTAPLVQYPVETNGGKKVGEAGLVSVTALEKIMNQQLRIMSQQLELLGHSRSIGKSLTTQSQATTSLAPVELTESSSTEEVARREPSLNHSITAGKSEPRQPITGLNIESTAYVAYQPTQKGTMGGLSPIQEKHLKALIARHTQRTRESKRLAEKYRPVLADGRNSVGFRLFWKEMVYQVIGARMLGSKIWDVDGNEYVDVAMGFGVHLFGHSPRFLTEALAVRLEDGLGLGVQSDLAGPAAELLCEITGTERAIFCNSGTEAILAAIRVARTVTRRNRIALFTGAYHGWSDATTVRGRGAGGVLEAVPASPGVSPNTVQDVLLLEYDSSQSLEYLKEHSHELAAVLVEPVQSHRPDLQPKAFLHELRRLTEESETPLIFDEMVTGFRMHQGGVQALFGIQADLVTYGKIVGGGMPIGVIAGKSTLMDTFDGGQWSFGDTSYPQAEKTLFGGTFFKHPLALAAACAVLKYLKDSGPQLQEDLNKRTSSLVQRLNSYFDEVYAPIRVAHFGSLFRFVFDRAVTMTNLFFYHLLNKDIFTWEGRNCFLSVAHSADDIERIIRAVRETVTELREGGFLPAPSTTQTNGNRQTAKPAPPEIISVPLTEAQRLLWITVQKGDDASIAYNESTTLHLRGVLNLAAMRYAIQLVVERHEALRTTFSREGDSQLVHPRMDVEIPLIDCSQLNSAERDTHVKRLLESQVQQAFDLVSGPLLRACVVKVAEEHHILVLTIHHLVIDGLSFSVLLSELSAIYSAECQGVTCHLPAPMGFSKFVQWQADNRNQQITQSESYWLEQFAGDVPVLELPVDRPRPPIQTFAGGRQRCLLPAQLYRKLRSFSAEQRSTMLMTLLATYQILLHRLTGQNDIVTGIASAGQASVANERLVGYCVNLLPLRCKVDGKLRFTDLLATLKTVLIGAYEHQDYPFGRLLEKLDLRAEPSRSPLVNAAMNIDVAGTAPKLHDLEVEVEENSARAAKFDLYLDITETDGDTILEFEYNRDLFNAETIQRWLRHYATLLEGIVKNPEQQIWELPVLASVERRQVLVEWNQTESPYPKERCIHELFEAQVERSPDQIAVVFENEQVSYRELNARANQLAHYLRSCGVGPEVLVGIMLERSVGMVVALLGVLKAGGAYVPLDPRYPAERLRYMVRDAGVAVMVTEEEWAAGLAGEGMGRVISLNREAAQIARESEANVDSGVVAENLAYVIYTSGSTGQPKGISITHQAISRVVLNTNYIKLETSDRIAQLSNSSFDAVTFEIWGALLNGSQLVIINRDVSLSPEGLATEIRERAITTIFLTTALFNQFAKAVPTLFSPLRTLLFGGEAVDPRCVREVLTNGPPQRLLHVYGPTESTTFASWHLVKEVTENDINVPIGCPLSNTQLYVLDSNFEPVVIGARGELYIGGDGLARGYLQRPDLTAERFIPNPFAIGQRLYRTGDIVRLLPEGAIEFLGRVDNQVKVRGFRIELSEIETVLCSHPDVESCVVVARENIAGDGTRRLAAYISTSEPVSSQSLTASALRAYLKERLPDYMLPSTYVILENLPLTPNGKVDRDALPAPDITGSEPGVEYAAPRTAIEQTLSEIWSQVLGMRQIGTEDNFFELGGDSILSIQIAARAQQAGLHLRPNQLFQHQTIAELASIIGTGGLPAAAEQGLVTGTVPLTPIQSWFFEHHGSIEPHHWNQSVMILVNEPLDLQALDQAVRHLLAHHDALRMRFKPIATGWEQINRDREEHSVCTEIDFSDLTDEQRREAIELSANRLQTALPLAQGPLVRVAHLKSGEGQPARLLVVMHHLIVDGVSWRIFLEDLEQAYEQVIRGGVVQLGPKTTSYKEWGERLNEYAQTAEVREQVNYWQSQTIEPITHLPLDLSDGANTVESEDSVILMLEAEETATLLRKAPTFYGGAINELLIAVFGRSLWRWTAHRQVMIDVEGHGREDLFPDLNLSRTIGWFTVIFPLILQMSRAWEDTAVETALPELVKHVKERMRGVPLRGTGYGLLRYLCDDVEAKTQMRLLPQAEISFNYLGQFGEVMSDTGKFHLTGEPTGATRSLQGHRSYLLEVNAIVSGAALQISITYSKNLHRRETIERLADRMKEDLQWLVDHCRTAGTSKTVPDIALSEFNWSQPELDEIAAQLSIKLNTKSKYVDDRRD